MPEHLLVPQHHLRLVWDFGLGADRRFWLVDDILGLHVPVPPAESGDWVLHLDPAGLAYLEDDHSSMWASDLLPLSFGDGGARKGDLVVTAREGDFECSLADLFARLLFPPSPCFKGRVPLG